MVCALRARVSWFKGILTCRCNVYRSRQRLDEIAGMANDAMAWYHNVLRGKDFAAALYVRFRPAGWTVVQSPAWGLSLNGHAKPRFGMQCTLIYAAGFRLGSNWTAPGLLITGRPASLPSFPKSRDPTQRICEATGLNMSSAGWFLAFTAPPTYRKVCCLPGPTHPTALAHLSRL
jgi:hypothetical protein